ncbi:formate dehydrogenase subunit delta [Hyphomicrobium sp.]|jgi:formate dehydrogenase subunit delta|uniref:formate dehydrogenase subunit delta n=1 Tax=Hyphomicrobium sp. TaxID=82 RepID=UPI002C68FB07|nr:formate dehydrogenase subunit delta [Hyphomicrobium sp.]HVZ04716.1 formate dehydrogenase subunit delta [Hyphomicrobium sp.]
MEKSVLIQMANQITAFWSPYPKGEALESIAKHIHNSWEPRMRDQMKAIIDDGGQGLSPLFLEAMADYFKGPKTPQKAAPIIKSAAKAPSSG